MRADRSNGNPSDAQLIAYLALGWIMQEEARARQLMDLTGMTPDILRAGAASGDREVLGAILSYLAGHEPDLLACAAALEVSPQALVGAQQELCL